MPTYYLIYVVLLALGVLIGALRYATLSRGSRYALLLLIITVITETAAWYLGSLWHTNLIVYRLLIPTQFAFIALGYGQELTRYRRLVWVAIALVVLIWVVDFVSSFSFLDRHYPTSVKTICNLLIIGFSLLYLYTLLQINIVASFTSFPMFWLSLGWLLFSVVNLTYFATVNYLGLHGQSFLRIFDNIRMVSNFVLYTLFIVAFLSKQKTLQKAT